MHGDRKDSVKYEYPTTVIRPTDQSTATYETVHASIHEEDASQTVPKTDTDKPYSSPVEVNSPRSDAQLQHNPAYHVPSETTNQS